MKSIFGLLLVFIAFGNIACVYADESKLLRGGSTTEEASDEDRQLENNNSNSNNSQVRQWMQYYLYGNARKGNYYGNNYYNNQQNNYYNNGNDDQAEEDQEYEENDADNDYGNSNDDGSSSFIPSEVEEKFWAWYESPPSQWTAAQWAWFSGILFFTVGFMFCCCLGCANVCMEGQERVCEKDGDDYTSMDSGKRGSFTTNGSTVIDDDDQTYDSIMRMRSLN